MNTIKIDGLVGGYPEPIDGTSEWYYSQKGTDDFLDLYEAEEIVKDGHAFGGMNCHLIHFPDGEVFSPFELKDSYRQKERFANRRRQLVGIQCFELSPRIVR